MEIEKEIKSSVHLNNAKKVVLNLLFTENIVAERLNIILKPFDISAEQFNVLRILRGQKGKAINMGAIQERMLARNSNTTRLVDKLLLKKFVMRANCVVNRRKIEVTILQDGLDVLSALDPLIIEHEQHFANNLTSEEISMLNILLEKYRNQTSI